LKKSVIAKFLLGSFLVPSLLASNTPVKAEGEGENKPSTESPVKLEHYFLTNVLHYLPNTEDRAIFFQTCKKADEANSRLRLIDLSHHEPRALEREKIEAEAKALKKELVKSVRMSPTIETIRLNYRQLRLINDNLSGDIKTLQDVFNERIVRIVNCEVYGKSVVEDLEKFRKNFSLLRLEVENLDLPPYYVKKTEITNKLFFDTKDENGNEKPRLIDGVKALAIPTKFIPSNQDGIRKLLVEEFNLPPSVVLKSSELKDEDLVVEIPKVPFYSSYSGTTPVLDILKNRKDVYINKIHFKGQNGQDAYKNFVDNLNLSTVEDVNCMAFPKKIECEFVPYLKQELLYNFIEFFSNQDLNKFYVNIPKLDIDSCDYDSRLFCEKIRLYEDQPKKPKPLILAPALNICCLYIRNEDQFNDLINNLKKLEKLNMLSYFKVENIYYDLSFNPNQKDEFRKYLPAHCIINENQYIKY